MAEEQTPMIQTITTILPVENIEPSIAFWEAIGFSRNEEVPEADGSDKLGFIIFKSGKTEVMYQTFVSMRGDYDPFSGETTASPTLLFITVADLDAVINALAAYPVTMERRNTFYGADEIGYREPGGHSITFAQFGSTPK